MYIHVPEAVYEETKDAPPLPPAWPIPGPLPPPLNRNICDPTVPPPPPPTLTPVK